MACLQNSLHRLEFQEWILHNLTPAVAMPTSPKAKVQYLPNLIAGVPADVVSQQIVGKQKIACPARHLSWFTELDGRVGRACDECIGSSFAEVLSGADVRPRPDP